MLAEEDLGHIVPLGALGELGAEVQVQQMLAMQAMELQIQEAGAEDLAVTRLEILERLGMVVLELFMSNMRILCRI